MVFSLFIYVSLDLYAAFVVVAFFFFFFFYTSKTKKKQIFLLYVLVSILLSDVLFVIFHRRIYVIAKSKQCFIGHSSSTCTEQTKKVITF